jgi:hypothetical protein
LQSVKKNRGNLVGDIINYDEFKNNIIEELDLSDIEIRECLPMETVIELLKYFEDENKNKRKRKNDILLNLFVRLTLIAPTLKTTILSLKFSDFDNDFRFVKVNDVNVKLTSSLAIDIKKALENQYNKTNKMYEKDDKMFSYLRDGKNAEQTPTNTSMYIALREIGYDVPKNTDSYQVDCIRNTGIMELIKNNTNPLLIAKVSGLTLSTLEEKIKQFSKEFNMDYDRLINNSICKAEYYQYI